MDAEKVPVRLQRERITALLEELEQEYGPIDPRVTAAVRREWPLPDATAAGNRKD